MPQDRTRTKERTQISLRPYQVEYIRENEAFNLSGFVRQQLDDVIPEDHVPESHSE